MDKYEDAGRIEAELSIPAEIVEPMMRSVAEQDAQRGDWSNPRDARQPEAPWPAEDNPMLQFLLVKAKASLDAGMDPMVAVLQAAAHAWFEGGIENYDRGQRDARRPRSVG
jgi:hypothetical protein